jgi:lysophospholipase L1-like esterase
MRALVQRAARNRRAASNAIRMGRQRAAEFLEECAKASQRRRKERKPPFAGWLVALGDSWFNYFGYDILAMLEKYHGFKSDAVADTGNRIEAMANEKGYLKRFFQKLSDQIASERIPRAILLSGGGNDIVDAFEKLLYAANAPQPGWMPGLDDFIEGKMKQSYLVIVSAMTEFCIKKLQRTIPILVHGYAHPVPDGRGALGRVWLEPGFLNKGYTNLDDRKALAKILIDKFNDMLGGLRGNFGHVIYVNLRPVLSAGSDWDQYWENELHPTLDEVLKEGFNLVTRRIAAAIP